MIGRLKKLGYFILIFILLFQGCTNNCNDTACFTPPKSFLFELTDKTTNENLFTNGAFESPQIKITNLEDETAVVFDFLTEDDSNLIRIPSIGWKTEKVNALVSVSGNDIFNLVVDAERKNENCCEFTNYTETEILNATFELNSENGIYSILVEL